MREGSVKGDKWIAKTEDFERVKRKRGNERKKKRLDEMRIDRGNREEEWERNRRGNDRRRNL